MRKLINFLTLALLLMVGVNAYAVPALRVVRQYTQPDGTTVSLRLVGDEFSHFYLTEDDQMVLSGGDGYYFAELGTNGYPVASKVLASDAAKRTPQAVQLLATVNKADLLQGAAKKRAARAKARPNNSMKAPAKATTANWPSGIGLFPNNSFPVTGSPSVAIILVQFQDTKFSLSNPKEYFTGFASEKGFSQSGLIGGTNPDYNAHGSALDYFTACSNGKFTPDFQVLGPVTLPNKMAYYGGNDSYGDDMRPHEMVLHAVQALDATVDFSVFDTDNDGYIDNMYVIYAGEGEAAGGSEDTIWPHSWSVSSGTGTNNKFDGKILDSYACSAEILTKSGSLALADGIGTFCHEFSHVLGLPDEYDTAYKTAEKLTPNAYSLMDYGSYSNNSRTPPTYSIFQRNAMGWADIEVLEEGVGKNGRLEHMLTSNQGYAIPTGNTNEFFLLENRQQSDWDEYLPGHGMLVWHISYDATTWNNNKPNNSTKQLIDIVEAGGTANNENASTMKQYPFPGTKNVTSFTSSTTPALKSWSGTAINVPLTNIKEDIASGVITFDICGGGSKLDVPVCNYTSSPVVSETPVTITLTKPETAPATAVIKYIYMHNDGSDLQEGTYTAPITISQSSDFEYWLEDGVEKSAVTALKIFIGEVPPEEYTIVYKDSENDSTNDLTSNTYGGCVEKGSEIATFGSCSKVYNGINGLKFSSSKANGSITLNLTSEYQKEYTKVIVKACSYGSDAGKVQVDKLTSQSLTSELEDYTFDLDGSVKKTITISATNRIYVKSITFVVSSGSDEPVVPEPETVATPTFSVAAGEVEKGTSVEISSTTEGAAIHYTLDGTAPTAESTLYSQALTINEDVTVKAIAVKEGWNDSEVASAAYTVKAEQGGEDPDEVRFKIVYYDRTQGDDNNTFTTNEAYLKLVQEGADISTYKESTYVYSGEFGLKISSSKKNGYLTLNITDNFQKPYTKVILNAKGYGSDKSKIQVDDLNAQDVTSTDKFEDYTFDLDGSIMTTIKISATKRVYVKSITFVVGTGGDEPVVPETVATPTFSVEEGEVEEGTVVELACATEGATIHFTVDGSEPTTESDVYSEAIVIEEAMTIKAFAVKEGMTPSAVATANYTIKEQGGDEPIGGDVATVNFDFNRTDVDDLYGMELLSGNASSYNADGHSCVEGPITLTLHGKTRWWDNKGRHLRLYPGAYITVSSAETHDIKSVHLTVGTESHWDNTSHVAKVASVDFNTTHTEKNTVLHKVEVNYEKVTTSIVDVDAEDADAVYYNLQGIRVANPESGVFIRVQGNKVTKVVK